MGQIRVSNSASSSGAAVKVCPPLAADLKPGELKMLEEHGAAVAPKLCGSRTGFHAASGQKRNRTPEFQNLTHEKRRFALLRICRAVRNCVKGALRRPAGALDPVPPTRRFPTKKVKRLCRSSATSAAPQPCALRTHSIQNRIKFSLDTIIDRYSWSSANSTSRMGPGLHHRRQILRHRP